MFARLHVVATRSGRGSLTDFQRRPRLRWRRKRRSFAGPGCQVHRRAARCARPCRAALDAPGGCAGSRSRSGGPDPAGALPHGRRRLGSGTRAWFLDPGARVMATNPQQHHTLLIATSEAGRRGFLAAQLNADGHTVTRPTALRQRSPSSRRTQCMSAASSSNCWPSSPQTRSRGHKHELARCIWHRQHINGRTIDSRAARCAPASPQPGLTTCSSTSGAQGWSLTTPRRCQQRPGARLRTRARPP